MRKHWSHIFSLALILMLLITAVPAHVQAAGSSGSGVISLATLDSPYTQNFDTLSNTSGSTTNSLSIAGWYMDEALTGSRANGLYAVDTGGSNTGDTYSYGAAGSTDRAFGSLQSGSVISIIGASFTNDTSATITSLDIAYTGEEWRLGTAARTDELDFQYSTNATTLTNGVWTSVTALNFVTPDTATAGAKDGNAVTDRMAISATISGLNIASGATFWIRWNDFNVSGSDDGLAVDDFSLIPRGGVTTNPSGIGAAAPNSVFAGDATLLTVAVTPGLFPTSTGLTVTCDLTAIGGSATQTFYDDASNGDVTSGDNTFSYSTIVAVGTTDGIKSLPCTIGDSQSRSASATIGLTVLVILPIGTVQGSVSNSDNGATFSSPYAGQTVVIQGVIYEKVLSRTSSGGSTYAFFMQNANDQTDGDPNSSDGIYVYIGGYSTLRIKGGGYYTPKVGDEVILQGPISEYYNFTEIGNPYLLKVVRSNVDIAAEVPAVVANPPDNLADANRYWERLEGMRVQVPQNSIVLGGRNVFNPADAEVWVASPNSTIALRADPYTRRAFRDAHPLDDNYDPANWDGNGYRILLGSWGIKAAAGNNQALIEPLRTFDTVTNAPSGGLNYTYSKYRIEISEQPALSEGVDPAANNPPQTFDRTFNYSIVDYNLENLYDYRDNPFSGCDFANVPAGSNPKCSKTGTPFLSDVTPAYDYVPASDAVYQARLADIATQIINDLHSPDVLMVQEVENQDICTVTDGALTCGATDNADGKPDVLQELALKVASLGGPAYDAAFDRDSSDLRGIAPSFMYRTDRVELLPAAGDPVLGMSPAVAGYTPVPLDGDVSNPKTLNALLPVGVPACETSWVFPRAPDVGLFRIYHTSIGLGSFRDVYVINNHFKSRPDTCVAHRTEQARYNAALVAYIEAVKPDARIVLGGDLNVYPRPDDIAYGASDQLGSLYDPSLGLKNLWEVLLDQAPEAAYSYVYVGMAQTLDQMFVNGPMLADLNQFRIAHINSDFPADYPDDAARGTSDHDPNFAVFSDLPTIDRLKELVMYYDANGMITGNNTARILLDRLDRAAEFKANGQQSAYEAQLQAFINQVQGKAPRFITQEAADSLSYEASLLLSLP